jgi:hypothetical protein
MVSGPVLTTKIFRSRLQQLAIRSVVEHHARGADNLAKDVDLHTGSVIEIESRFVGSQAPQVTVGSERDGSEDREAGRRLNPSGDHERVHHGFRVKVVVGMKVLRNVCGYCGYVMLFSVNVLSRPNTTDEIARNCPICKTPSSLAFLATELDMEEVTPEPDPEKMMRRILQFVGN